MSALVPARLVRLCCAALACAGAFAAAEEPGFHEGDWPFRPLARPAVPAPRETGWARNAIDCFILKKLEEKELLPSAEADKATLLRRVTFDLTGLPPTAAEQSAFLADDAPDAYERVVERLLDSPRFGERWAVHWLDLVHYADTSGYKTDELRSTAYVYRDYVIRAFNEDLPYDRFLRQQVAGDELEPGNPDALAATGFDRLYPSEWNASDFLASRQTILDDLTEVTSLAFLGLTLGCAKCHDHKFDPIVQTDYYRLQACFASMLPLDDVPMVSSTEQARYAVQMREWETATKAIRLRMDVITESAREEAIRQLTESYDAATRAAVMTPPEQRSPLERELCALASRAIERSCTRALRHLPDAVQKEFDDLESQLSKFDRLKPPDLPTALSVSDVGVSAPATFVLETGDCRKPKQEVAPGFPEFLGLSAPEITSPSGSPQSSGRRAALARWLTRPDHPLVARVMANRLWQHHLGRGIIGTPNDFGAMGDGATHSELLDWLACELVDHGWSLKHLHRMIVTSAAYRQASLIRKAEPVPADARQKDESDRLLWRARRQRLEGESLRDAILALSGDLNLALYGPCVFPQLPKTLYDNSRDAWDADEREADWYRRSVYVVRKRNLGEPFLAAFDAPDLYMSCPTRTVTITAPQTLSLLNSDFTLTQARRWAGRLLARFPAEQRGLIVEAYREAYGRAPENAEIEADEAFLAEQAARIEASGMPLDRRALPEPLPASMPPARAAAVVDFCHAIFNSTEFQFVE